MTLVERIEDDLRTALKSSDKLKVSVLRMIKASLKNREIDKGSPLSDDDVLTVLGSLAKQTKESIKEYERAGRGDLAQKEKEELSVIQSYLPEQLSEEEIERMIHEVIEETAASSVKDMGKVMKVLMPRLKGRADGKRVNQRVREILNSLQR